LDQRDAFFDRDDTSCQLSDLVNEPIDLGVDTAEIDENEVFRFVGHIGIMPDQPISAKSLIPSGPAPIPLRQ
jgi:hypothetical protein